MLTHILTTPPASPRVALVTGATDGIGKATARHLLAVGWEVVLVGRGAARCQASRDELAAAVPGARVSCRVADLSRMDEVRRLADEVRGAHPHLHLLLENANAITQERTVTADGLEANLAIGYAGRALLALELDELLARTPGSQVMSVVGLNLEHIDLDNPSWERGPDGLTSMKALGLWQWAIQVFAREWNRRGKIPMNTYMPGLVRTKILASEPQPMRLFAQLATRLIGVPADRGGQELAWAIEDAARAGRRDGYYARTKAKPRRDLGDRPGDGERLWELTERLLARWRRPT